MKGRLFRTIALLALLTSAITVLSPAKMALAGSNGQQLSLAVSCQYAPALAEVRVTGRNQNNQTVTWYSRPNARNVATTGWWWKGSVTIDYRYAGTNPYTGYPFPWYRTTTYVPTTFNRDYYPVAVDQGSACRPF